MGIQVCNKGLCQCNFGAAPSPINVLPDKCVLSDHGQPAATINDHVPFLNITPFGLCHSPQYPTMSLGIPGPCVPATSSPWVPGSSEVFIQNIPALSQEHKLMCQLGGVITIVFPGQTTVIVS